jgi:hypothetical protein
LFPAQAEQFPVRPNNIPCFDLPGIRVQDVEINMIFNTEIAKLGKNRKFPVIFPVLREFADKDWGWRGLERISVVSNHGKVRSP